METETLRDTMECQTRSHIRPPILPALRKNPYRMRCRIRRRGLRGQAPFRCCNPTCLVQLGKRLVSLDGDGRGLLSQSQQQSQLVLHGRLVETDNVTMRETHSAASSVRHLADRAQARDGFQVTIRQVEVGLHRHISLAWRAGAAASPHGVSIRRNMLQVACPRSRRLENNIATS